MKVTVRIMTNNGQKLGTTRNGVQNFESMSNIILYVTNSQKQKAGEAHIL